MKAETVLFSWRSPQRTIALHHAWLWTSAVCWARKWFPNVVFVGDQPAKVLIFDGLGLPFTDFLELPELPADLIHVRDLTKIAATLAGIRAFGPCWHHDHDGRFNRRPPEAMLEAPFVCEYRYRRTTPENWHILFDQCEQWNAHLPHSRMAVMPEYGLASGLMGGCDYDGIERMCETSIRIATHPDNRRAFAEANGFTSSVVIGEMAYGHDFPNAHALLSEGGGTEDERRIAGWNHIAGGKENAGLLACLAQELECDFPSEKRRTFEARSRLYR